MTTGFKHADRSSLKSDFLQETKNNQILAKSSAKLNTANNSQGFKHAKNYF